MSKVYVVTEGCYSDYCIRGVFDDKELALHFIAAFGNHADIEEWELNPHKKQLKKGYSPWFVRMAKDGTVIETHIEDSPYGFGEDPDDPFFDVNQNLFVHVFARDREHAIKITNERRTVLIATERWLSTEQEEPQ